MRKDPKDRKYQILSAALLIAERSGGFSKLTREAVAKEVGCAEGLVSRYFGTMVAFKRQIMRAAIINQNLSIVAQGLAVGDIHAQKADKGLKSRALAALV